MKKPKQYYLEYNCEPVVSIYIPSGSNKPDIRTGNIKDAIIYTLKEARMAAKDFNLEYQSYEEALK